jgi:tRNA-modifying protein YgfZ
MQMTTVDAISLADQYRSLADGCGLLDRSERGKLALTGKDAAEFLNGQVTNDVLALSPGEGCYAAFLTHKGKMLGDLRVLRTEDELLLDTERCALQELFDTIRRFKVGYRVELHKRTLESALLSLIGPATTETTVAALGTGYPLPAIEHGHLPAQIDGTPVRMICTLAGLDVLCEAADGPRVSEALRRAGAQPASEAAAEILRVEQGTPRYGADMDDATIPQEASLNERAISFTKGCYVGQETVARLHYRGKPNRLLRGLCFSEPIPTGAVLRMEEREVGHVTSSVLSPRLGPIGLALTRVQASPGTVLSVGEHDTRATVIELPFPAQ